MCHSSKVALEHLKENVRNVKESTAADSYSKQRFYECKTTLSDIVRFSNCLSYCPHATKIWLDSLANQEDLVRRAKSAIAELRSTLATLPSFLDELIEIPRTGHKKDDEKYNAEYMGQGSDTQCFDNKYGRKVPSFMQKQKEYGAIVASVRSSVKIIASALESHKEKKLPFNETVPYNLSSKTD